MIRVRATRCLPAWQTGGNFIVIRMAPIAVVAWLLASEPGRAEWDDVRAIPAGPRIEIRLPGPNEGRRMSGAFQSPTADSVVVETLRVGV